MLQKTQVLTDNRQTVMNTRLSEESSLPASHTTEMCMEFVQGKTISKQNDLVGTVDKDFNHHFKTVSSGLSETAALSGGVRPKSYNMSHSQAAAYQCSTC